MIPWKKIIYCFGLSLQSSYHLGSLIQQQIDLVLLSLLRQLSLPPCSGYRHTHFFGLIVSIISIAHTRSSIGLVPSAPVLPYPPDATICSLICIFVWLDCSFTDILFSKSIKCSSFFTTFRCYCSFYKTSFYQQKCIVQ